MAGFSYDDRLRLAGVAKPGSSILQDRYAIGGVFLSASRDALVAATLGVLAAALVGTNSSPASHFSTDDLIRLEGLPRPGSITIYDRYAVAGSFLFQGDSIGGALHASLGALATAHRGTVVNANIDGRLVPTLGGLNASVRGGSSYTLFFDLQWALTPQFTFSDVLSNDGALGLSLGALAARLPGTALPPNSSTGVLAASLGAMSTSLRGVMTAPPARAGVIHSDLSSLGVALLGAAVPPTGNIGSLPVALGALSASLVGDATSSVSDGVMLLTLGALAPAIFGQFIDAGASVGMLAPTLGGLQSSISGTTEGDHQPVPAGHSYKPRRERRELRTGGRKRTFRP